MSEIRELIRLVATQTSTTYCIVVHKNADLDAIASAIVFRRILTRFGHKTRIITPEGLDSLSKHFIESLGINEEFHRCEDSVVCDSYVIIDSASKDQLGCYSDVEKFILIDHHEINSLVKDALLVIYDPSRKATSEIVTQILLELGEVVEPTYLTLLIGGILYDSRLLQLADHITFELMSKLIKLGGDYVRARNSMLKKNSLSYSEKVAYLKGISRIGIYRVGKYLMTITCIGAFESGVLKALLDSGTDIGIAIARRDEGVRIIIRVSESVTRDVGKPLGGELAQYLASKLGGSGGGHSLAGGAYVRAVSSESILKCIKDYLTSVIGEFKVIDAGRWTMECEGNG